MRGSSYLAASDRDYQRLSHDHYFLRRKRSCGIGEVSKLKISSDYDSK